MNGDNTTLRILNRLVAMHNRSLPMYLASARPWTNRSDEKATSTLDNIVADHRSTVDRLAQRVLDLRGVVDLGEFPMEFTDLHDLSIDFVIKKLIQFQKRDINAIQQCVMQLNGDDRAKSLAQESLGAAKGHLESLEELLAEMRGANP